MIGGWLNEFDKSVPFLFQRFRAFWSSELVNVCTSFPAPDERIRYIFPLLSLFPLNTFLSFEKYRTAVKDKLFGGPGDELCCFVEFQFCRIFMGKGEDGGCYHLMIFSQKNQMICVLVSHYFDFVSAKTYPSPEAHYTSSKPIFLRACEEFRFSSTFIGMLIFLHWMHLSIPQKRSHKAKDMLIFTQFQNQELLLKIFE